MDKINFSPAKSNAFTFVPPTYILARLIFCFCERETKIALQRVESKQLLSYTLKRSNVASMKYLAAIEPARCKRVDRFSYICPAKLALSLGPAVISAWLRFMGHLLVILMRLEKNSIAESPVMSMSPYLLLVPYNPPNEKGSLGTGMPMFTPSMLARKRFRNHSAFPPLLV